MKYFPFRVMFVVVLSSLLFTQQSWADPSCFNVGVVTKKTFDKKDKKLGAGDIKSLKVIYDYEFSQISGTITWNKVPTSKLITTITIGETSQDPFCNDLYENYLMMGWTKRFKVNPESFYAGFDKSRLGKIQVVSSGKSHLDFVWNQPSTYSDSAMTQLCVQVSTMKIGSAYRNSTDCSGNKNVFTCQGPGWIPAEISIDFVQNFAFSKGREVDSYTCRYPLGQVPGS